MTSLMLLLYVNYKNEFQSIALDTRRGRGKARWLL